MLTEQQIIPYLLKNNLITPEALVDGNTTVADASRRNCNFKVISEKSPCYLLKQGANPEGVATIANEAAVYQSLQSRNGRSAFGCYLPRFYKYDSQEKILILEFLPSALNLREYHAHRGRISTSHARTLGRALARLHRLRRHEVHAVSEAPRFSHNSLWALSYHRPDLEVLRRASDCNIQLIKIIQQFPEFGELLDNLRRDWRTEAFIHSDLKWDNCLVYSRSPSGRMTRLRIVDWEMAGVGDPCWDLGSVLNGYLSHWLLSIPITGETPPERFLELARYPLGSLQPAIRAFWQAYVGQLKLDTSECDDRLLRAVRYAAARLIQTAYEQMQGSVLVTGNIVCFLQLSLNMLMRPREASIQLLGIPLQGIRFPWAATMGS